MASISQQVLSFLLVVACLKFKTGNGTKQQNIPDSKVQGTLP